MQPKPQGMIRLAIPAVSTYTPMGSDFLADLPHAPAIRTEPWTTLPGLPHFVRRLPALSLFVSGATLSGHLKRALSQNARRIARCVR